MHNILFNLKKSKFRSSFHLKKKDIDYINNKGMSTIKEHAYLFVNRNLKELKENDGKQTPYRNHPVFIAMHAMACCCRGCLYKWHKIDKNKILNENEIDYIVSLIMEWIEIEYNGWNNIN